MTHQDVKLHDGIPQGQVAFEYYKIVHPDRKYNVEQARKQFRQDKNINKKIVKQAVKNIMDKQMSLLK